MIEYRKGNLLDVTDGVIVHGCNMKGVMGSGVALAIRKKYPECYKRYKGQLEAPIFDLRLGDIIWWNDVTGKLFIANGLTQENFGSDSTVRYANYAAIANVFRLAMLTNNGYESDIHFPKIGAGLVNCDLNIIEKLINDSDPHDKYRKVCWAL